MQEREVYEICVKKHFQARHNLKYSNGQQDAIHLHQWIIEVHILSEKLSEEGLVEDFREVDKILEGILDAINGAHINELEPFTRINPSAENLCRWFYRQLKPCIIAPCRLVKVVLYETEHYSASYREQ
ncbi:MAG: hypothetical protein A2Y62_11685 [Candidatus Fischerbacteria bacterium RBG_13_37_8]|uniref:6-carboxy-5,6,7,8-tetrahydropterin synthase n=1 Tax=Candidatus Fischerbacteria bacterium RBG_13_37_8 TaxID=1817863 RepID=A0A1F5VGV9_9BACT|nr:MAG: hypothetical protein A2Y62_11685 [Candidatus Fischerbacteria bacterium RBG_13_37_8]